MLPATERDAGHFENIRELRPAGIRAPPGESVTSGYVYRSADLRRAWRMNAEAPTT
jgi:hypothetical protein